ncbi:Metabotropic glutamate receptor [Lamellibrachia satsuma]|nr:Metabotropic glutamate receptor [Lamellibrachia satsuma]
MLPLPHRTTSCLAQVLVNVTIALSMPPEAELRMPVAMEPHVELACTMPQRGFIVALCYNVLLVVVCTCYAFKARTLPNNFNETKYISFCVYTTLVIWLAFLPSYFTTTRAFFQVLVV